MNHAALTKDLFWTGILDRNLRVFDIVMKTEHGTTYNSYVLKGSDKIALIDAAKAPFFDEFIANVNRVAPIETIDYLIVNHTEPDHAGSIEKVLQLNPRIQIVSSPAGVTFLKKIVNREFEHRIVKDEDVLDLGNKTLRFFILPNLHWPDTMFTYIEEDKILFTCDCFGAHYSDEGILHSRIDNKKDYLDEVKYYFDNIIGPFKDPFMINALKRIEPLAITMICTGHGPVLDDNIKEIIDLYAGWSKGDTHEGKRVVIPYVSAYGYTKQLAEAIAAGLRESTEIDVRLFDMVECDTQEVLNEMAQADGLLFGTPTMIGEALKPIWDLTTSMTSVVYKGKPASAFGSYGWSGEGVLHIIERLKQIRMNVTDGYRVRFKPNEAELAEATAFGRAFAHIVLQKND